MAISRIACSLLVAGAATVAAVSPAAALTGYGAPAATLAVNPNPVSPGQTVTVALTCPFAANITASGQANFTGTPTSINFGVPQRNQYVGTLRVPRSTTAGTYTVVANCSTGPSTPGTNVSASTSLTVTGPSILPTSVSPVPTGPAPTGDGASLAGLSWHADAGAGLLVIGTGLGALAARRRKARSRA